jgi:cytochrome c nitrite reductase small subunit
MLMVAIIIAALVLLVPIVVHPSMTMRLGGRAFALFAIVVVPVAVGFAGLGTHVERSKSVAFCTSCHVMTPYARSLHVDDVDHVPAKHWQYNRVPRETACFACHTDYTLYGDYKAKLRGLRHVWVQYLGRVPDRIQLYKPYNNRECLHCHDGARSFVEAVTHKGEAGRMEAIRANRVSCLSKGCHDTVHTVDQIDGLAMWPSESSPKEAGK